MTDKAIVQVSMNGQGVPSRRGFLRSVGLGAAGIAALSFTDLMALRAEELRKRRRACILLWMAGGPSQLETFDPKPDHPNGGQTEVIETAVPSIRIASPWRKTAAAMRDIALIRSMTNKEGNHQRATYQLHTGFSPSGSVSYPGIGSVVAAELGDPAFDLPHIVSIGGPTVGAGMLGVSYEPFLVGNPLQPPNNATPRVSSDRFARRMGLMRRLEAAGFARSGGAEQVRDHQALYKQTSAMVFSPRMKAFDLEAEDASLRDAYGRTPFGQGCLLARRLVEAGITFVEVRSNGWDTHQQNHDRVKALAEQVDPAFATLIADLKARGRLDRTLVLWMGEFGRTPRINPNAGRDHFPRVFNVALAGGGIEGGQVIGASSDDGTEVKSRPIAVNDLLCSLCHALEIDPRKENMSPLGRPVKIVDGGHVVRELFA
ncbi:MAG: DUF1501 domain-containing protein [Planctomycetaceae bacterium]|nr:DUF1501 domain-containing protein [Planctomycetaceae bacterium]